MNKPRQTFISLFPQITVFGLTFYFGFRFDPPLTVFEIHLCNMCFKICLLNIFFSIVHWEKEEYKWPFKELLKGE